MPALAKKHYLKKGDKFVEVIGKALGLPAKKINERVEIRNLLHESNDFWTLKDSGNDSKEVEITAVETDREILKLACVGGLEGTNNEYNVYKQSEQIWPLIAREQQAGEQTASYSYDWNTTSTDAVMPGATDEAKQVTITYSFGTTSTAMAHFASKYPDDLVFGHNYANAYTCGGGFTQGSRAQEEDLMREFYYYSSLKKLFKGGAPYGFPQDTGLDKDTDKVWVGPNTYKSRDEFMSKFPNALDVHATVNAVRMRGTKKGGWWKLLPKKLRVKCHFLATAAPSFKSYVKRYGAVTPSQLLNHTWFANLLKDSLKGMLATPQRLIQDGRLPNKPVRLVLGAWGSGDFKGPVEGYVTLIMEALYEIGALELYEEIHIAVPKGGNPDNSLATVNAIDKLRKSKYTGLTLAKTEEIYDYHL